MQDKGERERARNRAFYLTWVVVLLWAMACGFLATILSSTWLGLAAAGLGGLCILVMRPIWESAEL